MENKSTPTLTLDPTVDSTSVDAQILDNIPTMDIKNPQISEEIQANEDNLTAEEKAIVKDFAKQIDITNSVQLLQYGSPAQQKISSFSESALDKVKTNELDEIGKTVTSLVVELKDYNDGDQKGGFLGLFKKAGASVASMKASYTSVAKNVDIITNKLENHKITLLKDVAVLDQMYVMNLDYYKELSMYILAGKEKLKETREVDLPALQKKAQESGLQSDAQEANNMAEQCNRFEKKLYDLELTRTISMQMAPQIRMVQNNDIIMVDKIQSSIVNTIPLWKNQMVLTLGLAHSKSAIEAQRQVTDTTNELLKKNADILKTSTVEAAKESERGIVDIETLQHTNEALISTLDEVMVIQEDGRTKRREAETELLRIETELKNKLLSMSSNQK